MPLRRKLTLVMMFTSVSTLVLTVGAFFVLEVRQFQDSLVRELHTVAGLVGGSSRAALEFEDQREGHLTLEVLRADPRIVVAALYDQNGQLFAAYQAPRAAGDSAVSAPPGRITPEGELRPPAAYDAEQLPIFGSHLSVVHPIMHEGRLIGTVLIEARGDDIYSRLESYALIATIILVLAAVIAYALSVRVRDVISHPILSLSRTALAVSRNNDYSLRAVKESEDETGTLVEHFNEMLDRIGAATRALQESKDQLRLITDSLPVLISYVDSQHRYQFNNAAYERWFNRSPQELKGMHLRDALGESLYTYVDPYLSRALAGETVTFETRATFPGAGERYTVTTLLPHRGEDGAPAGAFTLVTDITEPKKAEKEREQLLQSERLARSEAERASRLKDEFLATLSHELRTPLNSILGWSQLLRRGWKTAHDLDEGLATIARNARVQTQLIEDLLDLSRIVSGKLRLNLEVVDLSEVLTSAIDSVRLAAAAKEIEIHRSVGNGELRAWGDPSRLQQIVWNLLTNAVKFTPQGGRIDVELQQMGSFLSLIVRDNGEGIDPEFLPFIFEKFRQADASSTRRFGGLGIGLALVKQLAELHGGTVAAASDGPGRGTSMTVTLPLAPLQDSSPAAHPGRNEEVAEALLEEVDLADLRILVVDDDPDAREVVRRALEAFNAEVYTAASALQGFDLFKREKPMMIVSDIGMPEHDGYEFMRWVRGLTVDEGSLTPAVALTAFARSDDRRKALAAGYQAHVAKPVEPNELVMVVASLGGRLNTSSKAQQRTSVP